MREDPLVGRDLAGFHIEALIGRGGMSRVYRAEQRSLGRKVAVKVLSQDLAGAPEFRSRFLAESRVAAAIEHPNILPVYDAGEADGLLYIAMRLVEGADFDLQALLDRDGALAPDRALAIVGQIAAALDVAHAHGLVHRDVKPGNVLLAGDHVYLTDFGIAKPVAGRRELTRTGVFVGTLDYASPEQIRNDPVDRASDIYSLGCLLFRCLTGQLPFDRPSEYAVMQAHLHDPVPSASALRSGLPQAIDAVFAVALAKAPDERYRSGRHLVDAARAALAGGAAPGVPAAARPTVADGTIPRATISAAAPREASAYPAMRSGAHLVPRLVVAGVVALALISGGVVAGVVKIGPPVVVGPTAEPSARPEASASPGSATSTPSPALTRTPTQTPSATASQTPTLTPTRTATPTPTPTATPALTSSPPPRSFRVMGTLRDSVANVGVSSAVVIAYRIGTSVVTDTATTDASGNFLLTLPADTYRLRLSSNSGAFQAQDWTGSLTVDGDRTGLVVRVLWPSSNPRENARGAGQAPYMTVAGGSTVTVWFTIVNTGTTTELSPKGV